MEFAQRTSWNLKPNQLTLSLLSKQTQGIDVLDCTISNPTKCHLKYPKQEILKAFQAENNLNYDPNPTGIQAARESIVVEYKRKGFDVSADDIFLTSSTSEGYSYLFRLLADVDDQILFPKPSYPLFSYLTGLNDVELVHYDLKFADRWYVSLNEIENQINEKTKAAVFVNPNNPTGSYVGEDELNKISKYLCSKDVPIISDEVFWDYSFDGKVKTSFVDRKEGLTFVLGGLSKELGLPQMKLSWIIISGEERLKQQAKEKLEVIADAYLSVSAPTQNALNLWFEKRSEIQDCIKSRILRNKLFLDNNCESLPIEGGWYGVIPLKSCHSDEKWALDLLEEENIYVHPGFLYEFDSFPVFIVSLLTPPEDFEEGITQIHHFINR